MKKRLKSIFLTSLTGKRDLSNDMCIASYIAIDMCMCVVAIVCDIS